MARMSRAIDASPLASARFRAVIGMCLVVMIGFGLIVPALPRFALRFGVGEAGVGLVVTAFALTRLVGDLFAGALIDRFGERAMTTLGVAIVGVSSIAAGAARSFEQLVVLRGVGGVGSAFFLGGLMAYLIGTTPADSRGRAMSVFQASVGVGLLIGPVVGGVLMAATDVNVPLYAYGAVCLATIPLALRAMGGERIPAETLADAPDIEPAPVPSGARAWSRLRPLLTNRAYLTAIAVSGLAFLVTSAEQTIVPLFWEQLGESEASSGLPFTVAALGALVVVWHAGGVSDRRGRKFATVPSLLVLGLATAALGFTRSAVVVVALMAVHGLASGYLRPGPSAMVADVASPEQRGIAVSGYRIAGDVGALIGPILAGALADYVSYRAAFVAVGAAALAVLVLAAGAPETAPARRAR